MASAGVAAAANAADNTNPADQAAAKKAAVPAAAAAMPTGKIGKLTVSRLVSGGNLISGWAHSRNLIYVPSLMRHYNTDVRRRLLCENTAPPPVLVVTPARPERGCD